MLSVRLAVAALVPIFALALAFSPAPAAATDARTQEIYRFPVDVEYANQINGPSGLVLRRTPGAASPYALYGTLYSPAGQSYVFKLVPPSPGTLGGKWTETTLYQTANSQNTILFGVEIDGPGALYGIQYYLNFGTVFKLLPPSATNPKWQYTTLPTSSDLKPFAGLTLDTVGAVYGTSYYDPNDCGLVFRLAPPLSPTGTYTYQVLHSFPYNSKGDCDAGMPTNRLVIDRSGNVYGTADPVIFRLSPPPIGSADWTYQVVYTWAPGERLGPLAIDPDGILYATSLTSSQSAIFAFVPPTSSQTLWTKKTIGTLPFDAQDPNDMSLAYSLMYLDGDLIATNAHSIFELRPPSAGNGLWSRSTLHTFGTTNQNNAYDAPFAVDSAGNLYGGVDCYGCTSTFGSAFKIYRTP